MDKASAGRPTKYDFDAAGLETVTNYCLLGCTDEELADLLQIDTSTLYNWKNKHPQFLEAIKAGKEIADARVARSLYDKALTGDSTAMCFWLKNRQRKKWYDSKHDEVTIKAASPDQVAEALDRLSDSNEAGSAANDRD